MNSISFPEKWLCVPLLSTCEVKTGKVDANHASDSGKFEFFTCALEPLKADTYSFDGDLIILPGNGANVGHVIFHSGKIEAYQRTYVLHKFVINPKYVYYCLLKNWKEVNLKKQYGSATNYIKMSNFQEFELPLPPLAEQKIIADKLDILVAQVEITKARLERISEILKTFRQSVLAAAVSGKLTEKWEVQRKSVEEVCFKGFDGPFGSKLKSSDYTESGVRVCRLENIGHLTFDNSKITYISKYKYDNLKKNKLEVGDVLFSSFVDEEVKVCVFKIANEIFINKADCFCLRPNYQMVSSEYLSYVLASRSSYNQIKEQVQGVTRPRINLRILKGLSFNFPPVEQQSEIISRVERLFDFADTIEQKATVALDRVNRLTQSILAKAFRGELTADWRAENLDLITGENSAESLLKKITAEQKKLRANKTRKR